MIELNNIDFSKLEKTCELPQNKHNDLWEIVRLADSLGELAVTAFELGASLAHQQTEKKVCALLKPA